MCCELAVKTWEWDLRFIIFIPWKHQLRVKYWSTLSIVYGSCPLPQNIWLNLLNCGRIEKCNKGAQRNGMVSMHRMTATQTRLGMWYRSYKIELHRATFKQKELIFDTADCRHWNSMQRVQTVLHQFKGWLYKRKSLRFTKYTENTWFWESFGGKICEPCENNWGKYDVCLCCSCSSLNNTWLFWGI